MSEHPLSSALPSFDRASYLAGVTAAFAEVVAMGCKQLALSPTYTSAELAALLPATQQLVAQHGLLMLVEPDLLITPLFPAEIARGLTVILIAREQATLDAYCALKALRASAEAAGQLPDHGSELAWRFGRLLSYSDGAIQQLLDAHSPSHPE